MQKTLNLQLYRVSGHFIQRPFCRKETISYNNTGVTLYKDVLYKVVPEFLHTHAEESFRTRILCTRIFIFFYNKITSMFPFVDQTIEK